MKYYDKCRGCIYNIGDKNCEQALYGYPCSPEYDPKYIPEDDDFLPDYDNDGFGGKRKDGM